MGNKIKLIWDFRGPDAQQIAEHHIKHLSEFAIREKLTFNETECVKEADGYWIASMVVSEEEMKKVRDALRPHRGTLA